MSALYGTCFFTLLMVYPLTCSAIELEAGGQLRGQTTLSRYPSDHLLVSSGNRQDFLDGAADFRLNSTFFLTSNLSFDFSYEAAISGGQSRDALFRLTEKSNAALLFGVGPPRDEQQFFSLTASISDNEYYIMYHRVDRLFLDWSTDFGNLRIGRQALTWGNGLVFNPADLVNPFAPTDIIRDYKVGADMLLFQGSTSVLSDFQMVLLPRRSIDNNELDESESTYGGKARISYAEMDFDVLAIKNYGDPVVGLGVTGYFGNAVYRTDLNYTFLNDYPDREYYISAIANIDYSWVWYDNNWYGFLEFYYNGLGTDSLSEALQDKALIDRLLRGELFVIGTYYLDALVQYEAHPLVNLFVSMIYNLKDHSFLLQPRLTWDITESTQLLAGFVIPVGGEQDEFGELEVMGENETAGRALQTYLVFTWFF